MNNQANKNQIKNSMNTQESYLDFSKRTMQNKDNYSRSNSSTRQNVPAAPLGPFNFIGVPNANSNFGPILKKNNYGAQGNGLTKKLQSFEPIDQNQNDSNNSNQNTT